MKNKLIHSSLIGDYLIYIYQGSLSKNDVLIKYKSNKSNRQRTPKHIHWAIDLLLKRQGNLKLTIKLINKFKELWNVPLSNTENHYENIISVIKDYENYLNLNEYVELNNYGEYPIEFLAPLMSLIMFQEKANYPNAYMFGQVLVELAKDNIDVFKLVSVSSFRGK
jgi:hypothetical protein